MPNLEDPPSYSSPGGSLAATTIRIREANFDDYAQVSALESRYGLETKTFDDWRHLWIGNPAYERFRDVLPLGWVLVDGSNTVLGYLGNLPLFYEFESQRLLACVARAWVVEEQHRALALMLVERYFSQDIVDLFLNATVGPKAAESFAVFESQPVPVGAWDRSAYWITDPKSFAVHVLGRQKIPFPAVLSRVFAAGAQFRSFFEKRKAPTLAGGLTLRVCQAFDERFETFWKELRTQHSHKLLGVRDQATLEWHFGRSLRAGQAWLLTAMAGNKLVGYAIFFRHDNSITGLRRVRLVDFQALQEQSGLLEAVLLWGRSECRAQHIHMLECIGFTPDKWEVITSVAPYHRQLPSWLFYYNANRPHLAERFRDPEVWDPSQYDGDASL